MGFKYYEQNQLMIPMEWKTLIDKNDVVFVLNDLIDNMNIDKLLETYSPLGNSSYSPKMMLKILMYGYIRKRYSSRQIAEAVQCDIKFIWLAGGNKPTRNVINSFRKDKMKIIMEDVFVELLVVLEKKGYINTEEYFVDGTKIEANANKYTFVWKKAVEKYRAKLQEQVHELMKDIDELNEEEDKLYPDKENAYTWWSYMFKAREKNAGWRIDYFIVSKSIEEKIKESYIFSEVIGSDHCPVGLDLEL